MEFDDIEVVTDTPSYSRPNRHGGASELDFRGKALAGSEMVKDIPS